MTRINLKDYYPYYKEDTYVDVPGELADLLRFYKAKEATRERKIRYHNAYFSLDRNDGIERRIIYISLSPEEIYERKVTCEELHAALETLPDKQSKRIYAHYFLGLTIKEIARNENSSRDAVEISLKKGLKRIERYLKKLDDCSK